MHPKLKSSLNCFREKFASKYQEGHHNFASARQCYARENRPRWSHEAAEVHFFFYLKQQEPQDGSLFPETDKIVTWVSIHVYVADWYSNPTNDFYSFDPMQGEWTTLDSCKVQGTPPSSRYSSALAAVDGDLYVYGGQRNSLGETP